MKEKDIQTEYGKYMKTHSTQFENGAYELKLCKKGRFDFSQIEPHQIDALLRVKHRNDSSTKLWYKIPDTFLNAGKKPFDAFLLRGCAYVVICFWESRKKKILYFVDIDVLLEAQQTAPKKSLKEFQVAEIADKVIDLKKVKKEVDLTLKASLKA